MIFGSTLGFYFALRFLKTVLGVFFGCVALVWIINYVDLARRTLFIEGVDSKTIAMIIALQTPATAEPILPFAVRFGALTAFGLSNRRLELVVVRAAGVSAWQFLLPGALIGVLIGIVATAVYNPLAAAMYERSLAYDASLFGKSAAGSVTSSGPVWLRQDGKDGESI